MYVIIIHCIKHLFYNYHEDTLPLDLVYNTLSRVMHGLTVASNGEGECIIIIIYMNKESGHLVSTIKIHMNQEFGHLINAICYEKDTVTMYPQK